MVLAACGSGPGASPEPPEVSFHQFATPQQIGTGLLNGTSRDGSAVYVEETDPGFPEPGCEGLPEPVMFRQPVSAGDREPAAALPLNGTLVRGGSGNRVAVVSGCEAFFTRLVIAQETPEGLLEDPQEVVPRGVPDDFGLNPLSFSWSNDGALLLAAIQHFDAPDGDPARIVSLDPGTGQVETIFESEQGTGVFKVGQLRNGHYVISTNLVVSFKNADGSLVAAFQGKDFEIAPGLEQVAIYGLNLSVVDQDSNIPTELVEEQSGQEIIDARYSAGGEALILNRIRLDTSLTEVALVSLDDTRFTSVVLGGHYGRSHFTGDNRALVFNKFSQEPQTPDRVFLVAFETP